MKKPDRPADMRAAMADIRSELDRLREQVTGAGASEGEAVGASSERAVDASSEEAVGASSEQEAPTEERPEGQSPPPAAPEANVASRDNHHEPLSPNPPEEGDSQVESRVQMEQVEEPPGNGASRVVETVHDEAPATAPAFVEPSEVVPERLVSKSDAGLAKTYEIATSLLDDAESRNDTRAIVYWRALSAAALGEAVRRTEFGKRSRGRRFSPKGLTGSRRRIDRLEEARNAFLHRES